MQLNSEEKEPYLVCLDPESGQIYTLGILSYNVHIEKDIPAKIKNKAKEALRRLADLRDLPGIKWWFKSEAVQMYRRRKLPIYLIQEDCPRYPTYEAHSNLSLAFKQVDTIEVHVSLVEYQGAMKDQGKIFNGEIRLNAALVSGADEVIKNVLRQLYKDYQIKLKPNHEKQKFVLKVSGLKEYFMGSVPMLAYETIRARLRGLKFIEVILSEISSAVSCETFPPTVERFKDEIKDGYYAPVDWTKYEETPFFIWYPPKELPRQKQLTEDRFDSKENNVFGLFKPGSIPIVKPLINTPAFDFRQKEFIRENEIAQMRKNCIYSGEMDLPFRLRVCGIDNLEVILSQFDQGATDNGLIEPNYITKSFARKDDGHGVHGQKKKKDRARDGFRVPKLVNYKKQEPPNLYLHHNDHGANSHLFVKLVKAGEFQILPYMITVEVALLYGCNVLIKEASVVTKPAAFSFSPRWNEWLTFGGLVLSQLPKELRICFNIKIHSPKGESHIIAATSHTLFDFHGRMKDGLIHLNLWPFYKTDPRFICTGGFWFLREKVLQPKPEDVDKFKSTQFARLLIQLDTFRLPLFWSLRDSHKMPALSSKESLLKKTTSTYELAQLKSLLNRDPLNWQFDEIQRELLIKCRYNYKNTSSFLPIFLLAIDWSNPEEIAEAHLMLKVWEPMAPEEALTLLDARFPDSDVRLYAVQRISEFSDDDLALYLLELVQALIYEDQHWSPLGEFLLERSLANPHMIGHQFFWLLRSQLHFKPSFERFTILLEQFLMLCGSFIKDLENEMLANQMIADIAEEAPRMEANVRQIKTADKISELKQKGLPDEFSIPIDPRMRGVNFVADECKILNSKKLPLLLSIENMQPDAKNIKIIFKTGDDLRQDLLTIQLIKIMDKIWLDNGLDLRMKPYRVQSTADQAGMIELVLDSENLSDIHQTYGGGALGALDRTTITKFLGKWNKPESMESAKENFIRSSAGYAVATYILGIGDRHSGNIMLTKSGHLFHIDFGHFLGHFKKKLGINRERTPFVFTKEMAFVMGVNNFRDFKKALESPDFAKFVNFSTQAYNLVRNNGNLLISLFIMMLSAGMPELEGFADIEYLMNQLSLDLSELEATNKFINEIQRSLEDTFRVLDNLFHAIKRKTESDAPKKKKKDKD